MLTGSIIYATTVLYITIFVPSKIITRYNLQTNSACDYFANEVVSL